MTENSTEVGLDEVAAARTAAVKAGFAAVETLVAGVDSHGDVQVLNKAARLLDSLAPAWPPAGEDPALFRRAYLALAAEAEKRAHSMAVSGEVYEDVFRVLVKYCR